MPRVCGFVGNFTRWSVQTRQTVFHHIRCYGKETAVEVSVVLVVVVWVVGKEASRL